MVGIIGGSGFYRLLDDAEMVTMHTPYGDPSAALALGTVAGVPVAFLPRHGIDHEFPPHAINYRANLWALREAGASWVIAPCASGSLQPHVRVGDFVVCDQYIDRTHSRRDTYCDGPEAIHVSAADPFSRSCARTSSRDAAAWTSRSTIAALSWSSKARASPPAPRADGSARWGGMSST